VGLAATTHERAYWRTLISIGYYTGLNRCDLARVRRSDIQPSGVIYFSRSKTGKRVCVQIPPDLIAEIDAWHTGNEPIWKPYRSDEAERVQFNRIVAHANLTGSFKKLRKSSGTQVELLHPGRGHEQLGKARTPMHATEIPSRNKRAILVVGIHHAIGRLVGVIPLPALQYLARHARTDYRLGFKSEVNPVLALSPVLACFAGVHGSILSRLRRIASLSKPSNDIGNPNATAFAPARSLVRMPAES